MKNILILGAGQLGSRHLQSVRNIQQKLNIVVVDPTPQSLETAKSRYLDRQAGAEHRIQFLSNIEEAREREYSVAVVATNSDCRFLVIKNLLEKCRVETLLLEKILFDREDHYAESLRLTKSYGTSTYVNLCMRMQTAYFDLKQQLKSQPFSYRVSGSNYGLITNAIHFLDHAVFLNSTPEFVVETDRLNKSLLKSKRPGFHELSGDLIINFANGSRAEISCYDAGSAPILIEIFSHNYRFVSKESENKYLVSTEKDSWKWQEFDLNFKYQSQLTEVFVEQILSRQTPALTPLDQACSTHLGLMRPLNKFITEELGYQGESDYPFT